MSQMPSPEERDAWLKKHLANAPERSDQWYREVLAIYRGGHTGQSVTWEVAETDDPAILDRMAQILFSPPTAGTGQTDSTD